MDKLNQHNISGGGSKVVSDRCRRLIPIQWLHAWSWTLHHQQHYAIKRQIQRLPYFPTQTFSIMHTVSILGISVLCSHYKTKLKQQCKKTKQHKNDRLKALIPPVRGCGRQAEESGELPQSPQSSVACTHRMEPHWRWKSRCLFGLE